MGNPLGWDPAILEAFLQSMEARVPVASREVCFAEWQIFQQWRSGANPPFTGPVTSLHIHGYLARVNYT
jgi:hypothetical protein